MNAKRKEEVRKALQERVSQEQGHYHGGVAEVQRPHTLLGSPKQILARYRETLRLLSDCAQYVRECQQ
jgi:hypothetical protein